MEKGLRHQDLMSDIKHFWAVADHNHLPFDMDSVQVILKEGNPSNLLVEN